VVRGVYRHILREALHKPENYGKWTMRGKAEKEKPEINSKHHKLNQRFFRKHYK